MNTFIILAAVGVVGMVISSSSNPLNNGDSVKKYRFIGFPRNNHEKVTVLFQALVSVGAVGFAISLLK
jgi:preprotein translocase subunit Sss1